ncbi:MAG TPA: GNAT family N-acetyltransferase [bacterium]|nr:GNAT family N-acetyltransferase [bacterium]
MRCLVRRGTAHDRPWVEAVLREHWGGTTIVGRGIAHDALSLPALVAERGGTRCGILTYRVDDAGCEIVTLNAVPRHQGTGSTLIEAVADEARRAGGRRLWLITTNDNLDALRFYQRRGFALAAIHVNAVADARKLKPSIAAIGHYGIPIRDEIELERIPAPVQPRPT